MFFFIFLQKNYMLSGIKNKYGKKCLMKIVNNKINNKRKDSYDIRNINSAAIIYEATDLENIKIVDSFVEKLNNRLIYNVSTLAYLDIKKINNDYSHLDTNYIFTNKDLNWYYKPIGENVNTFVEKQFDILFDLSLTDKLPIQFVVAQSNAFFKTGRFSLFNKIFYDLMIDISNEKSISLDLLILNMEQYLHKINTIKL